MKQEKGKSKRIGCCATNVDCGRLQRRGKERPSENRRMGRRVFECQPAKGRIGAAEPSPTVLVMSSKRGVFSRLEDAAHGFPTGMKSFRCSPVQLRIGDHRHEHASKAADIGFRNCGRFICRPEMELDEWDARNNAVERACRLEIIRKHAAFNEPKQRVFLRDMLVEILRLSQKNKPKQSERRFARESRGEEMLKFRENVSPRDCPLQLRTFLADKSLRGKHELLERAEMAVAV